MEGNAFSNFQRRERGGGVLNYGTHSWYDMDIFWDHPRPFTTLGVIRFDVLLLFKAMVEPVTKNIGTNHTFVV